MTGETDPWKALLDPGVERFDEVDTWRATSEPTGPPLRGGGVTLVVGAAGAVGASTVASGLALVGARREGRVLLIDLDLVWGDVHGAWGVPRDRTLHDLVAVIDELAPEHLAMVATPPVEGVALLLSPGSAHAAEQWSAEMIERLIGAAADGHQVVIDAGRASAAHLASAARLADRVIVIATPSVRSARGAAALVAELGPRTRLVVNHVVRDEELSTRAFARVCGARPVVEIPRRPRDARQIAAGRAPRGRRQPLLDALDAVLEGRR